MRLQVTRLLLLSSLMPFPLQPRITSPLTLLPSLPAAKVKALLDPAALPSRMIRNVAALPMEGHLAMGCDAPSISTGTSMTGNGLAG